MSSRQARRESLGLRAEGNNCPPPGPRLRRAHTLVELLLVLTILALFALIAVPHMAAALLRSHLDAATDAVRADLTFTRNRAIGSGIRHQFVFFPTTGEIVVEPFRPEEQAAGTTTSQAPVRLPLEDRLPEGIQVVEWRVFPLGYGQQTAASTQGAVDGAPIIFYPEGTGDSARIVLQDERGTRRGLAVDGFAGEIRELQAEELTY
jgi:type II secretory pathway pseudopilin PulG